MKKFHYRSVERNRIKLRELERKSRSSTAPSTSNNKDVQLHRTNNRESNVTANVQRSASNIQAQIDQLKQMMEELEKANTNEKTKSYPCLLSECTNKSKRGKNIEKRKIRNKTHNTRRKTARKERQRKTYECNKQYIKNPASFPDVSLAAKGVGAQGMKGRGKDARRLADFVFKMAECSMADDYAIFKKEHRPVCFTNFEGKVVFPHPVCQEEAVFLQLNGLQHHYRIRQ